MHMLLRCLGRFAKDGRVDPHRLIILSDARRGYDLERQRERAPAGCIIIHRTFGAAVTAKTGSRASKSSHIELATVAQKHFDRKSLHGIHWPNKRLKYKKRSTTQGILETASAHNGLQISRALGLGIDAILISTAFASASPSARRPLGPVRLAILARRFPEARLYGLGGISTSRLKRLADTGLFGVAGVDFGSG
jgi:thiamine-phosphate pyrophosphorylase